MVNKTRPRASQGPGSDGGPPAAAAPALTGKDLDVLRLLVEGFADKEIAYELGLSVFTINKSVQAILRYTDATSRTQAAVKAIKQGLVE
jgi:DNA-binding NarL/FixJ family response regulator